MNAKELTRSTLERGLNDPMFLLTMTVHEVGPEYIEDVVVEILEYLKTKTKFLLYKPCRISQDLR